MAEVIVGVADSLFEEQKMFGPTNANVAWSHFWIIGGYPSGLAPSTITDGCKRVEIGQW
jgi:hypothetical protein